MKWLLLFIPGLLFLLLWVSGRIGVAQANTRYSFRLRPTWMWGQPRKINKHNERK